MKLTMYITTDSDWTFLRIQSATSPTKRFTATVSTNHGLHIRLISQHFPSLAATPVSAIALIAIIRDMVGSDIRTLSHSLCTSFSASCLQLIRFSIQPSKVGIDWGSDVGDSRWGSGSFPISTSIFESIPRCLVIQPRSVW